MIIRVVLYHDVIRSNDRISLLKKSVKCDRI